MFASQDSNVPDGDTGGLLSIVVVVVVVVVIVDDILLPIPFSGTLRGIFGRCTSLGGWWVCGAQEENEDVTMTTTKTNTTTFRSQL